tara:strand:+ start:126344 stop:127042 length:699 start_codon:yes stop_codon:yes gene_type:complete
MSYALNLEKSFISKKLKIQKSDLINSACRINYDSYAIYINQELADTYPLIKGFILDCYKDNSDFCNSFGLNTEFGKMIPNQLKDKMILDSFFDDGYQKLTFNNWQTGHYLLINNAGIPFGIFGICDKAGFPTDYETLDSNNNCKSIFELPSNSVLFSIAISKKFRRRGLSVKVTNFFSQLFENHPVFETISINNAANQKAVEKMGFKSIGRHFPSDPFKAPILLYTNTDIEI